MRRGWQVAGVLVLLLAGPALADDLPLPTPEAARVQQARLITAVGGRPDRLLTSVVPGTVRNDELVRVSLGVGGAVAGVTVDQRLGLAGTGDFAVRERGPARSATPLGAEPAPVTRLGAVVWQGFSPGHRDLAARLQLDPAIEQAHLPLVVRATFTPPHGTPRPLPVGGDLPSAGTVQVTVTNVTDQPQLLPTATDVAPAALAAALDHALAVARAPSPARLPSTDHGLPGHLDAAGVASSDSVQSVPFQLTGSLRLVGGPGRISGPGTTVLGQLARVRGTLGGSLAGHARASVTFLVQADARSRLVLDLRAVSALNPAELRPPRGLRSWSAWATGRPPPSERRDALALLVAVAASGSRASAYSPYLGADLPGTGSTRFSYVLDEPAAAGPAPAVPHPRWGAIGLASLALALIMAQAVLLWRRS